MTQERSGRRLRIAFYTHDTFGLGHIRRCLHIIEQLQEDMPEAAILLVTGSPALHYLSKLPPHVDVVKIPTLVTTGSTGSLPPHLPLGVPELVLLRKRIIREAILTFDPDVFVVDNFPLGAQAELLPLLKELRHTNTKTLLGLRDILDGPEAVKAEWKRQNIYDVLHRCYDKILIYGVQDIFDTIKEYEITAELAKKVHFCGYVTSLGPFSESADTIRHNLGFKKSFIFATGGGGGDAFPLLSTLIKASPQIPESDILILTGPLMGEADRQDLQNQAERNPSITIRNFIQDLRPYLKAADVVVSMCGYNVAAEIVNLGAKSVMVPRTWRFGEHKKMKHADKEQEQILRAKVLAQFGLAAMIEPDQLTADHLAAKVNESLSSSGPSIRPIDLSGVRNCVRHISEMIV